MKPAILSIDLHRGHLDQEFATLPLPAENSEKIIMNNRHFFDKARDLGVPIIHVVTMYRNKEEILSNPFWRSKCGTNSTRSNIDHHNIIGSKGTEIIPELYNVKDYIVNTKKRYDCFYMTDLEFLLDKLNIDTLFITGVNTSSCVLNTAFEACDRDYKVYVVEECVDSMDGQKLHEAALIIINTVLGEVIETDNAIKVLSSAY